MSRHRYFVNLFHENSVGAANAHIRISNFIPFDDSTPPIVYNAEFRKRDTEPWIAGNLISNAYGIIIPCPAATAGVGEAIKFSVRLNGGADGEWVLFSTDVLSYQQAPREMSVTGFDIPINASFQVNGNNIDKQLQGSVFKYNSYPLTAYPVNIGADGNPLAGADGTNPATNEAKRKSFTPPDFSEPTTSLEIHRNGTGTNGGTTLAVFQDILSDSTLGGALPDFTVTETITNPSTAGASDGSIVLNVTQGVSPFSFLWADDLSTASSRTGLLAGVYSVQITDDGNPTNVQNFSFNVVDPAEEESLYPETFAQSSPINSIRFKVDEGTIDGSSVLKTEDNTNYCENPPEEFTANPYYEIFNIADFTKIQFRSDYESNNLQVLDLDNVAVKTLPLVGVVDNINDFVTIAGSVRDNGSGELRIYPNSLVNPTGTKVGDTIQIDGTLNYDQIYEIKEIQKETYSNVWYNVVVGTYVTDENCQINYLNNKRYNVYEVGISMLSDLGEGTWKLKFTGGDTPGNLAVLVSEWISVRAYTPNTLVLKYSNVDTAFDVDWSTGIEMMRREQGFFFKSVPSRDASIFRNSNDTPEVINAYVRRKHEIKIQELPWFSIERLALVYSCDNFAINKKVFLVEELPEPELFDRYTLAQYTLVAEEVGWILDQNTHDAGQIDSSEIEVIGGEGIDVLGV